MYEFALPSKTKGGSIWCIPLWPQLIAADGSNVISASAEQHRGQLCSNPSWGQHSTAAAEVERKWVSSGGHIACRSKSWVESIFNHWGNNGEADSDPEKRCWPNRSRGTWYGCCGCGFGCGCGEDTLNHCWLVRTKSNDPFDSGLIAEGPRRATERRWIEIHSRMRTLFGSLPSRLSLVALPAFPIFFLCVSYSSTFGLFLPFAPLNYTQLR